MATRSGPLHADPRHADEWAARWWYDGRVHAAWNIGAPLLLAAWVTRGLGLGAVALGTVLATAVVANGLEYALHRWPMHRRMWPRIVYERHTLVHHRLLDGPHRSMIVAHHRDWYFVLFPPWAVPLLVVAAGALGALVGLGVHPEVGRWFFATGLAYFSVYEALHLAYHLPFSERGVLAWLRAHHARHHQRGTCATHNFNVTLPLFDVLLRTRWRG